MATVHRGVRGLGGRMHSLGKRVISRHPSPALRGCDDLKFDNKFEVPVMYSTAIPESMLRYT
jgi:hypothetical protein